MNLRIYLIIEEGADRVFVCGTGYPHWYKKPADRRAEIAAVDIPLHDVEVDRVVKLGPERVKVIEAEPVSLRTPWCICAGWPHTDACYARRPHGRDVSTGEFKTCGLPAGRPCGDTACFDERLRLATTRG